MEPPPAASPGGEIIDRRAWHSLVVITIGSLVISLDTTISNLALPTILERWPGANVDWVVTAYLVGLGLSQPGAAWIIDRFGTRRTFVTSIASLTIAAFGAGMAPSFEFLVAFRLVQGLAGGALVPVSISVIAYAFPASRRGWVMGLWSTVSMVAPAVGPLIGGYLLTNASWRWAFFIHVPIGVVATVGALRFLGEYGDRRRSALDTLGWALATVGLLSLLVAFSQVDEWHWSSGRTLTLFAVAAAVLVTFGAQQRRTRDSLLALEIFSAPGFTLTMVVIGLGSIAYVARLVFMPLELTAVRGMDPLHIGWLLMPAAVGSMLASAVSGRLVDRTGPRPLVLVGGATLTVSHLALGLLSVDSPQWWIAFAMTVQIVGATFVVLPSTIAALDVLPPRFAGQVAMVRSMVRQLAAAFGVAVLASVLRGQIRSADEPGLGAGRIQTAYNRVFLLMTALGVATLVLAYFMPRRTEAPPDARPAPPTRTP